MGSCTLFEQFAYEKVAIAHIMGMRVFAYLASISPVKFFCREPLSEILQRFQQRVSSRWKRGRELPVDVTDGALAAVRRARGTVESPSLATNFQA